LKTKRPRAAGTAGGQPTTPNHEEETMGKSRVSHSAVMRRGATVAFWWFMVVSQHPSGVLTAATQGPFSTKEQCEWGRKQIAATTGLNIGTGAGLWGSTTCWASEARD
jgi:hypothetical protein